MSHTNSVVMSKEMVEKHIDYKLHRVWWNNGMIATIKHFPEQYSYQDIDYEYLVFKEFSDGSFRITTVNLDGTTICQNIPLNTENPNEMNILNTIRYQKGLYENLTKNCGYYSKLSEHCLLSVSNPNIPVQEKKSSI